MSLNLGQAFFCVRWFISWNDVYGMVFKHIEFSFCSHLDELIKSKKKHTQSQDGSAPENN